MLARATPLPERSKTFTIQVDTGRVHVFVAADDIHKKLVSCDSIRERLKRLFLHPQSTNQPPL